MTVDNYVIWSVEHDAWWGPNHHGYVRHVSEAGVYSRAEAEAIRDRAYIGWTRDTDPPEVLVPAFVGVSPTMATLAAAAVETARAGWSARDAIATRELDAAYRERAHLVAHLAAIYPSVIAHGTDSDAPGFAIVYVTLPGGEGQASWRIAESDLDLFAHVHRDDTATWDGHSTAEKYRRLDAATKVQGQWQENLWVRTEDGGA